jgi:hypothetical protein
MNAKATGIANTVSTRSIGTIVSISRPPKQTPANVYAFPSRGNTMAQKCPMCGELATCHEASASLDCWPVPSRSRSRRRTRTPYSGQLLHRRMGLLLPPGRAHRAFCVRQPGGGVELFRVCVCLLGRVRPQRGSSTRTLRRYRAEPTSPLGTTRKVFLFQPRHYPRWR